MSTRDVITQAELKSLLSYNPDTGEFKWLSRPITHQRIKIWNKKYAGGVAGAVNSLGYRIIKIHARAYKAHRLAWLYVYGEWPSGHLDHANCNTGDNRIENLRLASLTENRANSKRPSTNTSGYKGVSWHWNRTKTMGWWTASIRVNRKLISLGYFKDKVEAHKAYCAAAEKYFGKYANSG